MLKNPESGRRVTKINAPSELMRTAVPHLRIIDDETWTSVQAILAAKGSEHATPHARPRPVSQAS